MMWTPNAIVAIILALVVMMFIFRRMKGPPLAEKASDQWADILKIIVGGLLTYIAME